MYVLDELMMALLLDEDELEGLAFRRDWAGATPLHGSVANSTASLQLALQVYRERPKLIGQYHKAKHGVFNGENGLHILCVNSREAELCECVELAAAALTSKELGGLFSGQAEGLFFQEPPMDFYGSTVVSYAVAFSLQAALRTMLRCSKQYHAMRGLIDFNDPRHACRLTGFMPVHVAVANSLTGMVNFLLDLPGLSIEYDDMRARQDAFSACGKRSKYSLLNPLQVAAKLGDKKLVQYILRTQSKQQWVWGPVSSYHLDLHGIDSIGDTANDVMELVSRLDALDATKEMLLDEFMDGLLHRLFVEKYKKACIYIHYLMRAVDVVYLASMYALGFWMKEYPTEVLTPTTTFGAILPYITLAAIVPLLEEDLRSAAAWWASARGGPRDEESRKLLKEGGLAGRFSIGGRDAKTLFQWMQSHGMFTRLLGWGCAVWAQLWLLALRGRSPTDAAWPPTAYTARDRLDVLLAPLSIACFLHTGAFFDAYLFVFARVGILYKACFQMLYTDVKSWMVLFLVFLMNYGMVMYFVYPHFAYTPEEDFITTQYANVPASYKDADTEPAPRFLKMASAFQSLVDLAFLGEPLELDFLVYQPQDSSYRTVWKSALFFIFVLYYYFYVLMSLILLLNLLIAMMGDTYGKAIEGATLGWRVDFARRVLRLELQLNFLHRLGLISLSCGQKVGTGKDAKWVFEFKSYQANSEGGGTGGRRSMFDQDVEEEAEADEKDDDGPGALGDAPAATPALVRLNTLAELEKAKSGRISKRAMLEQELDTSCPRAGAATGRGARCGSSAPRSPRHARHAARR